MGIGNPLPWERFIWLVRDVGNKLTALLALSLAEQAASRGGVPAPPQLHDGQEPSAVLAQQASRTSPAAVGGGGRFHGARKGAQVSHHSRRGFVFCILCLNY